MSTQQEWNEYKAKRKAALAAMPRCTFCDHRGTWKCGAGEPVLLCGWCFRKARRLTTGGGLLACFHTWEGYQLRALLEA